MAQGKDQLVDEGLMEKMSVAPPDPSEHASGPSGPSVSDRQDAASDMVDQSGVADEDPLSAHPS